MTNKTEVYKSLKKESAQDSMSDVAFGWSDVSNSKGNVSIEIDPVVFTKIMHWINKEDYECSGLGMVEVDKVRNVFRVVDAVLLKQENTSATTELDGHAIGRAMHEFRQRETPGQLRWWWHSHVKMGVFWSGTDEAAIKTIGGGNSEAPAWFLATVFNQNNEMLSAFVSNHPVKTVQTGIKTSVRTHIRKEVVDSWDAEYDDKVELPPVSSSLFGGSLSDDKELWAQWRQNQEARQLGLGSSGEVEAREITEAEMKESEEVQAAESEDRIAKFYLGIDDEGWSVDDVAEALESEDLTMDDVFRLHDDKQLNDDELDWLFTGGDDEEANAMDIGVVGKKSLRDMQ